MNCCCDTDCTQADIQAFSECTSLPSKYKLDKDVDYWNCTNSNLQKEDWFPILCVQVCFVIINCNLF